MRCSKESDCGTRFCTQERPCFIEEKSLLKIGDKVKDCDGTVGKVIEIRDNGNWIRLECQPYMCLSNLICYPKKAKRIRKLWNMRRNLIRI